MRKASGVLHGLALLQEPDRGCLAPQQLHVMQKLTFLGHFQPRHAHPFSFCWPAGVRHGTQAWQLLPLMLKVLEAGAVLEQQDLFKAEACSWAPHLSVLVPCSSARYWFRCYNCVMLPFLHLPPRLQCLTNTKPAKETENKKCSVVLK